jgi:hypothetical protein
LQRSGKIDIFKTYEKVGLNLPAASCKESSPVRNLSIFLIRSLTPQQATGNAHAVQFKQVLERYDGLLGFSKTNIHFEEREFDQKIGTWACGTGFWEKYCIIQINITPI